MGASGSGKTTLLNCIATVIKPTSGQVLLSGANVSSFDSEKLAEYRGNKIGYLFQDFALLDNLTGRENILLPLAVIPCLLETLYLGKCGKSQRISVYVLGLLIPSIVEKVALYLIGAFLCGIDPANIAGVMEAAASREPFVNLFTQPSARYVINILFFNWAYIVCGILFSALCIVFLSKARKVTAA